MTSIKTKTLIAGVTLVTSTVSNAVEHSEKPLIATETELRISSQQMETKELEARFDFRTGELTEASDVKLAGRWGKFKVKRHQRTNDFIEWWESLWERKNPVSKT